MIEIQRLDVPLIENEKFKLWGTLHEKNTMFIHLTLYDDKLTPSLYKELLIAGAQLKRAALKCGLIKLWVLVPEHLRKFEEMFGWEIHTEFLDMGLILMSQPTESPL